MEIISALLVGLALAMDSFSVSVTAGGNMKHIKVSQSLLIAGYFGFFQWLMTAAGWYGGSLLYEVINRFDHWVAMGLLTIIGGKMIYESFKDEDEKKFIFSHKILFILGIATSIDAFGVGLSYSLVNRPILFTSVIVGVTTFILSYMGVYLGKYLHHILKNRMELIGGMILIGIGIKIAIDHGVFG